MTMTGMSIINHFQSVDPPWAQLLVLKKGQDFDFKSLQDQLSEFVIKVIDGSTCKNRSDLFSNLASLFEFPSYFGRNWDALDECITDLEWMPGRGYILLLKNADQLLSEDARESYATFIGIMKKAGEEWSIPQVGEWSRQATPFHVLLAVSDSKRNMRTDWALPEISLENPGIDRNGVIL
jgi:RNAse (barnase) inhibitor barstar